MADLRPFMLMTDLQAARFREDTAGDENFLDPRYVEAGPYKGKYVLPERLLTDDTFAPLHPVMRMLTVVATCRQQGRNVLDYLTMCFEADSWGQALPSLLPATTTKSEAA